MNVRGRLVCPGMSAEDEISFGRLFAYARSVALCAGAEAESEDVAQEACIIWSMKRTESMGDRGNARFVAACAVRLCANLRRARVRRAAREETWARAQGRADQSGEAQSRLKLRYLNQEELEVFRLLVEGRSVREIAEALQLGRSAGDCPVPC